MEKVPASTWGRDLISMVCISPISKDGGLIIACGQCMACRMNHARMWSLRMMHEAKAHDSSVFVTLTYDDKKVPKGYVLVKEDLQKFFKRLRKEIHPKKIRYFASGEYGDLNGRPHYHAIIFGLSVADRLTIQRVWGQGFTSCGTVTPDSCQYTASYVMKKLKGADAQLYKLAGVPPEFAVMSRGGKGGHGLGYDHIERNRTYLRNYKSCTHKGRQVNAPRFYLERVLSSTEMAGYSWERAEKANKDLQEKIREGRIKSVHEGFRMSGELRKVVAADLAARSSMKRRKL